MLGLLMLHTPFPADLQLLWGRGVSVPGCVGPSLSDTHACPLPSGWGDTSVTPPPPGMTSWTSLSRGLASGAG